MTIISTRLQLCLNLNAGLTVKDTRVWRGGGEIVILPQSFNKLEMEYAQLFSFF